MIKKLFIIVIACLFTSCYNNAFNDVLFRTTEDPFCDTPETDSLSLEHTVYLKWKEDEGSDKFRLMRSPDQNQLSFTCIYEGTETSYTDSEISSGNRYIYRLDKIRGSKYFEGNTYGYGYSSDCRKDAYENNDTEHNATFLESDLICNIHCVKYFTNNKEYMDTDWFYVTVPPRRTAEIIINQQNLANSMNGTETDLKIQVAGRDIRSVCQNIATPIENTEFYTQVFYFKVFPERTTLSLGNTNTYIIEYTVSLNQIVKY